MIADCGEDQSDDLGTSVSSIEDVYYGPLTLEDTLSSMRTCMGCGVVFIFITDFIKRFTSITRGCSRPRGLYSTLTLNSNFT